MAVSAPIILRVNYISMICIQFFVLNPIHYAAFNNTAEYTLLYTTKYAPKMLFSTHPSTISSKLRIPLNYTFRACLTLCSQVSSQEASKYTPSMFPRIPPRAFSSTLLSMLSTTLQIAHDGLLAAIYALMQALKMLSSMLPTMLSRMFPIALHDTLPAYFALCFQIQSQEARHSQFHLTICSHISFLVFDQETGRIAATRHQGADYKLWVAGGILWQKL